ncbi:hypothetical protein JTB14_001688 [Gonioctena quinquepunctata]|nr:hypothetical protein JTB14_001688 [Gonioctena quinquepunctata]
MDFLSKEKLERFYHPNLLTLSDQDDPNDSPNDVHNGYSNCSNHGTYVSAYEVFFRDDPIHIEKNFWKGGTVAWSEKRKKGQNAEFVIRKDNSTGLHGKEERQRKWNMLQRFWMSSTSTIRKWPPNFASTNRKSGDDRIYTRYFEETTPRNGSTETILKQPGQDERTPSREPRN